MTDATPGKSERCDDRMRRDTTARLKFNPHYCLRPRLTPSGRLARRVISQLFSQMGIDWRNQVIDGKTTFTITLNADLLDRAIWELGGGKK